MRSMGDADYVYTPHSDERRAKMSAAQRARLGIPPGFRMIAGVCVAEEDVEKARAYFYPCESCGGARSPAARKCLPCAHAEAGSLKAEILRRLRAGETSVEIQAELGVTKGKVSGIAFRAGIPLWSPPRAAKPAQKVALKAAPEAPKASLPSATSEAPERGGQWIIKAVSEHCSEPDYWHNSKQYGGWWPHPEGARRFDSFDDAQTYARKKFHKRMCPTPVLAAPVSVERI